VQFSKSIIVYEVVPISSGVVFKQLRGPVSHACERISLPQDNAVLWLRSLVSYEASGLKPPRGNLRDFLLASKDVEPQGETVHRATQDIHIKARSSQDHARRSYTKTNWSNLVDSISGDQQKS
jgi:hypothetical protein